MKLADFSYNLPARLIAEFPMESRTASRLLTLQAGSGTTTHRHFIDLPSLLRPGDLLVFNDTRVIPARLIGHKPTGGSIEVLLERMLEGDRVLAQVKASKSPRPGGQLVFDLPSRDKQIVVDVMERQGQFYVLQFPVEPGLQAIVNEIGHIPLPPYIQRDDTAMDSERYQTVYARNDGAVAAPTAGLHFDDELLRALDNMSVQQEFLTLHVGAGTFQPVRVDEITEHKMHSEYLQLSEAVCASVDACKAAGGRVIAVGTTSVRALETAAQDGVLKPYAGDTNIFIYPGYEFQVVDAMITNFHLPESTLLMLVSAFAGQKVLLDAYIEAIAEEYRFYSYGDAMFIHR